MTIVIEGLEFETIIGVLKEERESPQKVVVDLKIKYDYNNGYLDYSRIIKILTIYIQTEKFELIETALVGCCNILKKEFRAIKAIDIKIKKPDIIDNAVVGVQYTRKF